MGFPASLRQSLTLHFLVVATLPLLLLGLFGNRHFENQHMETVAGLVDSHALNVSRVAGEYLADATVSLGMVEATLNSGLLASDAEISRYLQLTAGASSFFESIYLLDEDQRVSHVGLPEWHSGKYGDALGLDFSGHEIFRRQPRLAGQTWSDTFLSGVTAEPSITLAIPMARGTLLGTFNLQRLSAELTERLQHTGGSFRFSLLDRHGTVIADSRPVQAAQRHNLGQHSEVRNAIDHQIESAGVLHEDGSLLESVRLVPVTGWVAYVGLPVEEARKNLAPLRFFLVNALGFAVSLGLVLAVWLSMRMARPIQQFREAAREVTLGRYDQILQPAHYEELEDLRTSFREMMSAVDERENALKVSEARFRAAFEANPDSVLLTRLSDGQILSVNEHFLGVTGYAGSEVIGRTTVELGLWTNLGERDSYLRQLRENGAIENFEVSYQLKNGRTRIGLVSGRTLEMDDQACLLAVVRDITELKEAEKRLLRSEGRFRSLVAVMGEGLIIFGLNGEVVQCNQAAERILKQSADAVIGASCGELMRNAIGEDGAPCAPGQFCTALTPASAEKVANRLVGLPGADGGVTWLQVNTHPLGFDDHGQALATVMTFADVTRLKRTEEELREKEKNLLILSRQFKGVLEAIPDQILVLDRAMHLVWVNRQVDEGLAGQVAMAGIPCRDWPEVLCGPASGNPQPLCAHCPIIEAFASARKAEARMSLADGRTLSLRAFPVCDPRGEVINVIETVQDITESVHQQTQATRTGQLAALGELAAGVAHEINNPINGVINYAQLILNKAAADSREGDLAQRIIRESERIATIVRELLFFAREESGEVHRISIGAALDEVLTLTRNQLDKEEITLQVELAEDLPWVWSRSHQVQQLLLNLLSNARYALNKKYPAGSPDKLLLVTAEEIAEDGKPFVRMRLRDHGVGIAAELLPRVMNPFITTKPSAEGTGLGLSISHEIARKHGGSLSIASVEGEFTEVVVTLPAAQG